MERIPNVRQCWGAQVKMILKVHLHKDLEHRLDTREGATDLSIIDYLYYLIQCQWLNLERERG